MALITEPTEPQPEMLPGHRWQVYEDLYSGWFECICGFRPKDKDEKQSHALANPVLEIGESEHTTPEEHTKKFLAFVAGISERTLLDFDTIVDLLRKGWSYKEEIGQPSTWVSPASRLLKRE